MADGKPNDTTVKTLFAVSGNVCAFRDPDGRLPACEERLTDPGWRSVKARICHIAGRRRDSARYDKAMTDEERAHFNNLILMCPTHHVLIDDLEPDRFSVEILLDMKEKALEANGPRMGLQQWATDAQLTRYVALASVATQRQYAAEEAPVTYDLTATVEATMTATADVSTTGLSDDPAASGQFGFAGTTGFPNPNDDRRNRYALQVRQILGYENVLTVDDLVEPGRIDISTNTLPTDAEFDQLGQFARENGLSVLVTSQGERRQVP
jgi:hypothetical protein